MSVVEASTENRPLKIGITCYPTYGGSGVVATELGIELAARGHEIHFITSSAPFRLTGREANIYLHQVEMYHYPLFEHAPYDLALATRMAEVARFYKLDLLHVHYAIPHSVSAYLAKQMLATRGIHLPFITTLHGTDITLVGLDRSYLPITRFGIQQSDGVTAISSYLRERTHEAFGIDTPIEVVRNFVNCDVYTHHPDLVRAMRPRFALHEEKLLVHLSNFRPVKRVADVVKVFAKVAKALPCRLMLIGDGPDRSTAEYLARELGVFGRIHFLGKQDNVNELLPLADLMLLPSEMESFGLAALEAMACRVPPIATNIGGIPELIDQNSNGFMFDVGDIDGMAQAAISLLQDPDRLEEMSRAARQTAQDRFCTTRIIPLYEAYYRKILNRIVLPDGPTARGAGVGVPTPS